MRGYGLEEDELFRPKNVEARDLWTPNPPPGSPDPTWRAIPPTDLLDASRPTPTRHGRDLGCSGSPSLSAENPELGVTIVQSMW